MTHKMGLVGINLASASVDQIRYYISAPSAVSDANYTWYSAKTTVYSSKTYDSSSPKPYKKSDYLHYYISRYTGNTIFTTTDELASGRDAGNNWTETITNSTIASGGYTTFTKTPTTTYLQLTGYTLALGDVFYSDGSVSKPNAKYSTKTAIGIVAYIGNDIWTEKDYGGGHALVLALKPESNNKRQWGSGASGSGYTRVDIPGSTNVYNTSTMLNATTGYANTYVHVPAGGYQLSNFPALYYGVENGNTPYPTPKGSGGKSTGWFLPSISQWCKVIASPGLGNIAQSSLAYGSNVTAGATAVTNINNALAAAGGTVTLQSGVNSGVYWTSSENGSGGQDAVNIGLFTSSVNFTENGYGNYKYDQIQLWSMLAF